MTTPTIPAAPPGHQRIKLLRAHTYAREDFQAGAVLIIADREADALISARLAVPAPLPSLPTTKTNCPRCASPMEFATSPAPEARWTQCQNPACGHGWLR